MPTATIEVQFVNPPKPGKKQGSVKTVSGEYYGVDPTQLGQFQPGSTYTIEYETRVFNGKEYRNFRRMDASSPPPAQSKQVQAFSTPVEITAREIVASALHGVGTLPDTEILTTWFLAVKNAFEAVFGDTEEEKEF